MNKLAILGFFHIKSVLRKGNTLFSFWSMNRFDVLFFSKYIPSGDEIQYVAHRHVFVILTNIINHCFFGIGIPVFLYYYSLRIQEWVPFFVLEGYLFVMYGWILYKIFDWYNDVWIVTKEGVIEIDWKLFSVNSSLVRYQNIEGIEVAQEGIIDTMFGKGRIIINKIGGEQFILEDAARLFTIQEEINSRYVLFKKESQNEETATNQEMSWELLMEAMKGVVEEYLQKKQDAQNQHNSMIEEVKNIPGTIDLRE